MGAHVCAGAAAYGGSHSQGRRHGRRRNGYVVANDDNGCTNDAAAADANDAAAADANGAANADADGAANADANGSDDAASGCRLRDGIRRRTTAGLRAWDVLWTAGLWTGHVLWASTAG